MQNQYFTAMRDACVSEIKQFLRRDESLVCWKLAGVKPLNTLTVVGASFKYGGTVGNMTEILTVDIQGHGRHRLINIETVIIILDCNLPLTDSHVRFELFIEPACVWEFQSHRPVVQYTMHSTDS